MTIRVLLVRQRLLHELGQHKVVNDVRNQLSPKWCDTRWISLTGCNRFSIRGSQMIRGACNKRVQREQRRVQAAGHQSLERDVLLLID